jgi:ribose transport system permease protein
MTKPLPDFRGKEVLVITVISGVTIQGIETYVQNLFYGGALVVAVTLSQLVSRRRS